MSGVTEVHLTGVTVNGIVEGDKIIINLGDQGFQKYRVLGVIDNATIQLGPQITGDLPTIEELAGY